MSDSPKCPKCGADLLEDAPQGLCPKCLLNAGFQSQAPAKSDPERPTVPSPAASGFVPPEPADLANKFPHLEILELLGHGGMGAVYRARQTNLDRLVALKIIRPEATHDPAFAGRFNREAKTLARLSHQHIVTVHDFGEVDFSNPPDGKARPLYFFLMEYVDGVDLRQLMRAGDLTPHKALEIVPQICEALQYAHDEGVVHRDIKPENILIDKRGRVKIADFGLAKLAARSAEEFTLTGTQQVMGTPRYMAPEQMEASHSVDHRADIYSLGVVFYEMLTGQIPAGHFEPPSRKVEVDVRLDEVVLRAMAREPERRYQRASDVKTDVESVSSTGRRTVGVSASVARSATRVTDGISLARRRLRAPAFGLIALGGVSLLLLLLVVLGTLVDWEERGWEAAWQETLETGPTVLTCLVMSMPISIVLIAAGARMIEVRSYRLAIIAAILAMLPLSVTVVLGLPIGIWTLIVLSRLDVRRGFALRKQSIRAVAGQRPNAGEVGLMADVAGVRVNPDDERSGKDDAADSSLNPPHLLLAGIMTAVGVLCLLAGAAMVAAAFVIDSPSRGTFWGFVGGGLGTIGGGIGGLVGTLRALRHRPRKSPPQVTATPRTVAVLAVLMVAGSLVVATGMGLIAVAVLTQPLGTARFWGLMGGAFGCILGGCGGVLGSWNSYRHVEGREDLMNSGRWNWLDTLIGLYTAIGVMLFVITLAFSQIWGNATIQTLLTVSAIVAFQGVLFLVSRGLVRRGAASSTARSRAAATTPAESPQ